MSRHSLVDKRSGKFISKSPPWDEPGSKGFWNFVSTVKPRILTSDGTYQIWTPLDFQQEAINNILAVDKTGNRKHLFSMLCWSRRTGKSYINCLLTIYFFLIKRNFLALILSTKREQALDTSFKLLTDTIKNTPKLIQKVKHENIYKERIEFPKYNNKIQAISNSMAAAFGARCNLLHASEIHISPTLEPFRAILSSLVDSEDSLAVVDTNTDAVGGPVHAIELQAKTDPTVYVSRIEYKNVNELKKKCPPWLNLRQIEQLQSIQLPAEFARDFLNLRTSAANALFTKEIIELCKTKYSIPVDNVEELLQGRSYVVGSALDRSKALVQSKHSDATVWTVTAKTTTADGQPEYWILNQKSFRFNTSKAIKEQISIDHKKYGINSCILEHYETGDLVPYITQLGIKNLELLTATPTLQNSVFPELFRITSAGNLHISTDLKTLQSEMATFNYEQTKNGLYKFQHSSQKYHDDCVFSLAYSIHATRANLVRLYELGNIQCVNKSPKRRLCYILNPESNMKLLCAERCLAAQQVKSMFEQFKQFQPESKMTLPKFYHAYCRRTGALIQQAA
ncbi:MAG: hypothetical protein ACYSR1_01420 [Planctomycetota bacterium]|jgi:hypothetical protein